MEEGEGGLVSRLVYAAIISLETRPSPSSTRACSVSYNYAWEYFVGGGGGGGGPGGRRPGTFYHVMRAATYLRRCLALEAAIYQEGVATVVYHILTSQHHTMTLYDSRGTHQIEKKWCVLHALTLVIVCYGLEQRNKLQKSLNVNPCLAQHLYANIITTLSMTCCSLITPTVVPAILP